MGEKAAERQRKREREREEEDIVGLGERNCR